jgi:hypothetical protein
MEHAINKKEWKVKNTAQKKMSLLSMIRTMVPVVFVFYVAVVYAVAVETVGYGL